MKVVVISDIHIFGPEDPFYGALLALMRDGLEPGDHFVLAGDIFDFLVGNQPGLVRGYAAFFESLRDIGLRGVRTTYIEGNHDFHLHPAFRGIANLTIVPEEVEIATPNRRIYVAHGDLVDVEDRGYRALRFFFRSPFIRGAARMLPEAVVRWIARRSADSFHGPVLRESETEGESRPLRKTFRDFARRKFLAGFDAVVLGHCHDLDGADFSSGERVGRYLNVGYPRIHRQYVVFTDENGLNRVPFGADSPR